MLEKRYKIGTWNYRLLTLEKQKCQVRICDTEIYTINYNVTWKFFFETAFESNLYFYKKFPKINIQINCMNLFIKSHIYDKERKIRINKVK